MPLLDRQDEAISDASENWKGTCRLGKYLSDSLL